MNDVVTTIIPEPIPIGMNIPNDMQAAIQAMVSPTVSAIKPPTVVVMKASSTIVNITART